MEYWSTVLELEFYSLYVNDLPLHTNVNVNLFADDTVIIVKNKNMIELQKEVN